MNEIPPRSILIVRLSSLGDVVHTIPALAALRRHWPQARIDWAVERRCRDVLLDNPDVNALLEVDTGRWRKAIFSPRTWSSVVRSVRQLRERRYDLVLDLQGTLKSSVWSFLARGDRRVGFARRHLKEGLAALFYTERIDLGTHQMHVIDRQLGLLEAAGVPRGERRLPLVVPDEIEEKAENHIRNMPFFSGYVVLNPGGTWSTKRWSPERYGELAASIAREWELPSLVFWGPGEESLAERVVEAAGGSARLAPKTTVREMLPYLRRARLLVSGDTGPMHLASALDVPVVAVFGPTDPVRNGPFGSGDEVVFHSVPCGPCYKQVCPGYDNICMTEIEVTEVLEAVRRLLASTGVSAPSSTTHA